MRNYDAWRTQGPPEGCPLDDLTEEEREVAPDCECGSCRLERRELEELREEIRNRR